MSQPPTKRQNPLAIQPRTVDELYRFAEMAAQSGFFSDAREAAQAMVKIAAGQEMGIAPIQAMTSIHVIQGKISMSANLMAAILRRAGFRYKVLWEEDAAVEIVYFDPQGEELGRSSYSLGDAQRAELLGNPAWRKHPRNMLFARAMMNGARWYIPELAIGIYDADELDDLPDATFVPRHRNKRSRQSGPPRAPQQPPSRKAPTSQHDGHTQQVPSLQAPSPTNPPASATTHHSAMPASESAKEPVASTKEPVASAKEPVVSTKEPVVSTKESVVSTKESVASTKESVASTKEPVVSVSAPQSAAPFDVGGEQAGGRSSWLPVKAPRRPKHQPSKKPAQWGKAADKQAPVAPEIVDPAAQNDTTQKQSDKPTIVTQSDKKNRRLRQQEMEKFYLLVKKLKLSSEELDDLTGGVSVERLRLPQLQQLTRETELCVGMLNRLKASKNLKELRAAWEAVCSSQNQGPGIGPELWSCVSATKNSLKHKFSNKAA